MKTRGLGNHAFPHRAVLDISNQIGYRSFPSPHWTACSEISVSELSVFLSPALSVDFDVL